VRAAAVGVPTWIALLALLPFTGMGVGACLAVATALAIVAILVVERLRGRGKRMERRQRGPRTLRSMSPFAAAALTLGAVALVVYIVWVIRAT
jgi:hypothetical protein